MAGCAGAHGLHGRRVVWAGRHTQTHGHTFSKVFAWQGLHDPYAPVYGDLKTTVLHALMQGGTGASAQALVVEQFMRVRAGPVHVHLCPDLMLSLIVFCLNNELL